MLNFRFLVMWLISIGYLLTNKQKTAIFDVWAILGVFLAISSLVLRIEQNQFTFSGTLVHPNIFRLGLFQAFFDAWFAQKKFLTELKSPISAVHFSFATIFQYFNFVRFCSYSKSMFF